MAILLLIILLAVAAANQTTSAVDGSGGSGATSDPLDSLFTLGGTDLNLPPPNAGQNSTPVGIPGVVADVWTNYDPLFQKWGDAFFGDDTHWQWTKAICLNETMLGTSTLPGVRTPRPPGDRDGLGIMQVTPVTAADLYGGDVGELLLTDDDLSIQLATKLLWHLSQHFQDDQRKVVISYNQGATNTDLGHDYTGDYYSRFLTHLQWVQS